MKSEQGFNPYDNNDAAKAEAILEGKDLPPPNDEGVQEIRRAIENHRKGNDPRKAA
jgi:hypothetical protein